MGLRINTNSPSVNAQRNLAANSASLGKSLEKLSSGLRINRAGDDAAGLAIGASLDRQIRGLDVAIRNANDGISLSQTAEGALASIGALLQRMSELAIQAANGTLSTENRATLNSEFTALTNEIDRIAKGSNFNGINLLQTSTSGASSLVGGVSLQVGATNNAEDRIAINVSSVTIESGNLGISGVNISGSNGDNALSAISIIGDAINTVNSKRGELGVLQNRMEGVVQNLSITIENLQSAKSRVVDTDFARETAVFTRNQILVHAGTSILAQANTLPQAALQLLR